MENIKPVAAATSNAVAVIKPEEQTKYISIWGQGFDNLAKSQGTALTSEQRACGMSIITALVAKCAKQQIETNKLDMTNFYEQVKHCARLNLSFLEGEVFVDTRNNKNTGKVDVTVRKQYQGAMKLASRWCSKNIVDWHDEVVFEGDEFSYDFDYNTGLYNIKFRKNPNISRDNLAKVTNAFATAYVIENGHRVPYTCIIDKQRIMRAFNASSAKEKGPWETDVQRMVRKTAYWCLYNDILKPFIDVPADLQDSDAALNDEMDFSAQPETNDEVYDMPVEETNDFSNDEPTIIEPQQDDFENYLNSMDEQPEVVDNAEKEVFYSEYKNNKEKYKLVEGSYDAVKKTCRVILK